MRLWQDMLNVVVCVTSCHADKVAERITTRKQVECDQDPWKVTALNRLAVYLHGNVWHKFGPHVQNAKHKWTLHYHEFACEPTVNDTSDRVEQEHCRKLSLFVFEVCFYLVKGVVNHHHRKKKVHAEPSSKKESSY